MKLLCFVVILFCSTQKVAAQEWHLRIGLSFDFGNEVKRFGLRFDAGVKYDFIQVNAKAGVYYNFMSWGAQQRTPEVIVGLGAHVGGGKKEGDLNPYVSLFDHHLNHNLSIGYVYQYYFDWQGTSQSTGMIIAAYKKLTLLTENDLLGAGQGWRDRFRTGGFKLFYRYQAFRIGANLQLYTGDYSSCTKVLDNSVYPARFGYLSQDKAVLGYKSLGVFSIQAEYRSIVNQSFRVDVGVNAEKIRHIVQNRGLHDMPFYTDNMVKRKLMHIPMLQENGRSFLFAEGQEVRPAAFFYNFSLNSSAFY